MSLFEDSVAQELFELKQEVRRIADQMPDERTLIATLCLSGILGDSNYVASPAEASKAAVDYADALLKRLREKA